MTINKKSIAILFVIFLTILFIGCSSNEKEEETRIVPEGRYGVIVKIGSSESQAIIDIKENRIQLEYNNINSPLCGLKETFQKNHYTSDYHGIIWESDEFTPETRVIFEAIEQFKTTAESKNKKLEGETTIEITKKTADGEYRLYLDKNTNKPIELCAAQNGIELSLRFIHQ